MCQGAFKEVVRHSIATVAIKPREGRAQLRLGCQRTEPLSCLDHARLREARGHQCVWYFVVPLPRIGVKQSAILPAGFIARPISRNPATASDQTCIELIASALSKLLLSKGKLSTEPCRRSTRPLWRAAAFLARACSTI